MGAVRSLGILVAGVIVGAGAVVAYRIAQESGRPVQEVLSEVPGELGHLYSELKAKAAEVLEKGQALYGQGQQEADVADAEVSAQE